jgi:hypothetical protein
MASDMSCFSSAHRIAGVRVRRIVGWLEGREPGMGKDVLDSDHSAECRYLNSSRPNASDSVARFL